MSFSMWAYKKLFGLPRTTPTAGIMVTLGCLFTSIKVDRRQMMYFRKIIERRRDDWVKKTWMLLENDNIGWAKQIKKLLEEYGLPSSWERIGYISEDVWKEDVDQAIEKKNKEKLLEHCLSKNGEKTKTKSVCDLINGESFKRKPQYELLKKSKLEVRALMMARYGMLDCRNNYERKYKTKLCPECKVLDNEGHRINDCIVWKRTNLYSSETKVDFEGVHSSDPETLSLMAMVIIELWDIANGKNEMKICFG